MFTHDAYALRAIEYLSCLGFLALFSLFWTFLNSEPAAAPARRWAGQIAGWFQLPDRVYLHRGHAWARLDAPGVMTIGIDDFAQRLVGPIGGMALPSAGDALDAGKRAWALTVDGRAIDVLAPVTGTVLEVNDAALQHPELVNDDPYGRGWILKVDVPRTASAVRQLVSGDAARAWLESVTEQLTRVMSPELGQVCQDGGLPVAGLARAIDEARWDDVARQFLS